MRSDYLHPDRKTIDKSALDILEHDAGARADPLSKSGLDKVYCRVTKDLPGRAANLDVTFLREIGIAEYDPRGYAKSLTK